MPLSGRDLGEAEAYADELLLHFGQEDELDDADLDDLLDEEFGFDDLDDELDEGPAAEGFGGAPAWPSRVLQAEAHREEFGKFAPLAGVGKAISSTASGMASFAASAGQGMLASGYNPWAPQPETRLEPQPVQPAVVVSDRQSLPPVYVIDPTLAAQARAAPSVGSPAELVPTTSFGASFQEGSVRHRRGQDREAMIRAQLEGGKELREAVTARPEPLVEDPTAGPLLLSDGRLVEPVHGRLTAVSCFSCSRLPRSRYGRTGNGCVVCDDYGAILVPSSDLPSIAGAERFGFIGALLGALAPLAGPAMQIGGGAAMANKQSQAAESTARASSVYARLKAQLVEATKAPPASPAPAEAAPEKVSGLGGAFGDLDDLEDLDAEDFGPEEFGSDENEGDDLDFLDDDDPLLEDDDEEDDFSSEGRIVRVLFPRGSFR